MLCDEGATKESSRRHPRLVTDLYLVFATCLCICLFPSYYQIHYREQAVKRCSLSRCNSLGSFRGCSSHARRKKLKTRRATFQMDVRPTRRVWSRSLLSMAFDGRTRNPDSTPGAKAISRTTDGSNARPGLSCRFPESRGAYGQDH